jgi:hypothetical protein
VELSFNQHQPRIQTLVCVLEISSFGSMPATLLQDFNQRNWNAALMA